MVAFLGPLLAACTPPGQEAAPATGCAATVREASQAAEPDRQVDLLDVALLSCASYDRFRGEMVKYPGIVGYDLDTYLAVRCVRADDENIRTSPACAAVVAPPTTPPPNTVAEVVFVGDTLDGRRIEIRPSELIPFEGDTPAVVQQTVDIAVESGCDGVQAQRDLWAGRIDDPTIGDEASVFAQHAQNVLDYIQCVSTPLTLPGDEPDT